MRTHAAVQGEDMSVKTLNRFGKITITDNAIAMTAHYAASECYGVVDLVSRKLTDSIIELFKGTPPAKGVVVETVNNKIYLELYVVLSDGVNVEAICDSVRSTVKYIVETFTGMRVSEIVVNVVGVKL